MRLSPGNGPRLNRSCGTCSGVMPNLQWRCELGQAFATDEILP